MSLAIEQSIVDYLLQMNVKTRFTAQVWLYAHSGTLKLPDLSHRCE